MGYEFLIRTKCDLFIRLGWRLKKNIVYLINDLYGNEGHIISIEEISLPDLYNQKLIIR